MAPDSPIRRPFTKPVLTRHGELQRLTLQTGGMVSGGTFFGSAGSSSQWVYDDQSRAWVPAEEMSK